MEKVLAVVAPQQLEHYALGAVRSQSSRTPCKSPRVAATSVDVLIQRFICCGAAIKRLNLVVMVPDPVFGFRCP